MPSRIAGVAVVAVVILGCGAVPSAGDGLPLPERYTVGATWSSAARTLVGTESIRLRGAGSGALRSVWLRLYANDSIPGEADGCEHPQITIAVLSGARIRRRAVACSAVLLRLARAIAPGRTALVKLRFAIHVPRFRAQFGQSAGVDLLGRALPLLAVRDAAGWHLDPDTATGDPTYSLAAAWQATIRVPAALDVASTGAELSNRIDARSGMRVVTASTSHARDFALAIGRLRRRVATVDGVRVRVLFSSSYDRPSAAEALRNAVAAVRAYTGWYGTYGSRELDVVLAGLGGNSQEFPEIVFSDPDVAPIVHEVAHQWFYGIVGDDQYREPWLDESFATWNEEQLVPGTYPCDTRRPLGTHRGGLGRGLSYYENRPREYLDVIYRGGACSLTALAQMLGPERFRALLRTEVARYRYGVIHTPGFIALLGRFDPSAARRWTSLVGLPGPRS